MEDNKDDQDQKPQRDAEEQDEQEDNANVAELGDSGKAAIKAERDARKKAAAEATELKKRLDTLESEKRTADEAKAKEDGKYKELLEARETELADMRQQLQERDLRAWRTQAAEKHNIPASLVNRIVGDTEQDILADAESIAKDLQKRTPPDDGAGKGVEQKRKVKDESFREASYWLPQ